MKKIITILIILLIFFYNTNAQQFTKQTDIEITGACEGSSDWGDYNNDGLLDFIITGNPNYNPHSYSGIYQNMNNNQFEESDNNIIDVYRSSTEWGDYNNDNYLDIALSGAYSTLGSKVYKLYTKLYTNNHNGIFREQEDINLIQSNHGSISWGDYNNDGFLDLLHSGWDIARNIFTVVYKNYGNNNLIGQASIKIEGIKYSDVSWGDYNNDGFLDFVILGRNKHKQRIARIYKNNGKNNFEVQNQIQLFGFSKGSIDWGDYNNDGFLDLILHGLYYYDVTYKATKIYKNEGGESFTELLDVNLPGLSNGEAEWGDCNNDGFLDIILTGYTINPINIIADIYLNDTDNGFRKIPDSLSNVGYAPTAWGDYDNDYDIDLLLMGAGDNGFIAEIYKNNEPTSNSRPNIITNLQTEIIGEDIIFSWDEATDNNQPSAGLNYNIYVYEEGSDIYIASPQAFPQTHPLNGKRLISKRGQIQGVRENGRVSYILKGRFEECKTYYWSVQAIDASFVGGKFAPEQSFSLGDTTPPVPNESELTDIVGECSAIITVLPTAEDNCSGTLTATTTSPLEYHEQGNYQILWTYTDSSGNTTEQSQTVIIRDNTPPVITCPENITINLTEGQTSYIVPDQSLDPVSYEDNCQVSSIKNNYNYSATLLGEQFPIGTTSITWTATDSVNNQSSCAVDIKVNKFVGISEHPQEVFAIYPNPAKNYITIKFNNSILKTKQQGAVINMINSIGQIVITEIVTDNASELKLNTSKLISGIYTVNLIVDGEIISSKTIVK